MKLYQEDKNTIFLSQYQDPLLNHLTDKIIKNLQHCRGRNVLDLGCGSGRVALILAMQGFILTGIDIEEKAIVLAKEAARKLALGKSCKFLAQNILKTGKFNKESFDAVVCSEVIEHVNNPERIVNVAYQLLKKDGIFILTTPHDPKQWSVLDEYAQHKRRFTLKEIKHLFFHFKIIHLYTVGFPFMRLVIRLYHLIYQLFGLKHSSSWRKNYSMSNYYKFMIGGLLKIDDLFNFLNLGTTIFVVAQK